MSTVNLSYLITSSPLRMIEYCRHKQSTIFYLKEEAGVFTAEKSHITAAHIVQEIKKRKNFSFHSSLKGLGLRMKIFC
jgi:hypothetical protein